MPWLTPCSCASSCLRSRSAADTAALACTQSTARNTGQSSRHSAGRVRKTRRGQPAGKDRQHDGHAVAACVHAHSACRSLSPATCADLGQLLPQAAALLVRLRQVGLQGEDALPLLVCLLLCCIPLLLEALQLSLKLLVLQDTDAASRTHMHWKLALFGWHDTYTLVLAQQAGWQPGLPTPTEHAVHGAGPKGPPATPALKTACQAVTCPL